jgi:hypothetical protein
MTNRTMVFALLAFLFLLTGCSNGSKIEWQTKDFGPLTFEYPKDWVMPDNPSEMFYTFISRELYKPAQGFKDSVITIFGQRSDGERSVRGFIESLYVGDNGKIVKESETLVGGYKANRIETLQVDEDDQSKIHAIAYEVDTGSPLSVLFSIQYKDGYEEDVDIFEHLVASVNFDPKKR